jgi:hypothetical protein
MASNKPIKPIYNAPKPHIVIRVALSSDIQGSPLLSANIARERIHRNSPISGFPQIN